MRKQNGFTLMELIIVIVLLGILSAFAIPKYMSLDKEARIGTVKALKGSAMAAAEMVHGVALAKRKTTAGVQDLGDGLFVNITAKAYPTANTDGIGASLTSTDGFTANTSVADSIRYDIEGGTAGTCSVTYNIGATDNSPVVAAAITGC